jgi:hypothetical protein
MITILKKQEDESFLLVEEFVGDILELKPRLDELRVDGGIYRAEENTDCFSLIFDL